MQLKILNYEFSIKHMNKRNSRKKKEENFKHLFKNCKCYFEEFKDETNSKDTFLEDNFILNIVPGGRNGGNDKNIIEIFYGVGYLNTYNHLTKKWEPIKSYGATLMYQMFENGFTSVTLFPSKSKKISPNEEFIYLDFIKNSNKLKSKKTIKKHYKYLLAYMESTNIDGEPNLFQKFRVWKLRFFKELVLNGKVQPSLLSKRLTQSIHFIFNVCLSGLLIAVFLYFQKNPVDYSNELLKTKITTDSIQNIILNKKNENLIKSINLIEQKVNSIDSTMNKINN